MSFMSAIKRWFGHDDDHPRTRDSRFLDHVDNELENFEQRMARLRAEVKAESWDPDVRQRKTSGS